MRFLGLGLHDALPDATTLWLYREALARAGAVEVLFAAFDAYLREHGLLAMGGQIVDATIVAAPRQRNSRDENAAIKRGETPDGWEQNPAKTSQKEVDACSTKKHGRNYYGYKEFQLPSASGRSRQGAQVRAIQNTASSVRRWSSVGRPFV
jgi:IS5 family transposase